MVYSKFQGHQVHDAIALVSSTASFAFRRLRVHLVLRLVRRWLCRGARVGHGSLKFCRRTHGFVECKCAKRSRMLQCASRGFAIIMFTGWVRSHVGCSLRCGRSGRRQRQLRLLDVVSWRMLLRQARRSRVRLWMATRSAVALPCMHL